MKPADDLERDDPWDRLDPEERRLLALLARGASLNEAAASLGYSRRTVIRRLAGTRASLGVDTNVEALVAVRRHLAVGLEEREAGPSPSP